MFLDDQVGLDSLPWALSLEKTHSPSLSNYWLLTALDLEVRPEGISPSMIVCKWVLSLLGWLYNSTLKISLLSQTKDTLSHVIPWSFGSYKLSPPLLQCPLSLRYKVRIVNASVGIGTKWSLVLYILISYTDWCNSFYLLEKEISLMRSESYTYL